MKTAFKKSQDLAIGDVLLDVQGNAQITYVRKGKVNINIRATRTIKGQQFQVRYKFDRNQEVQIVEDLR